MAITKEVFELRAKYDTETMSYSHGKLHPQRLMPATCRLMLSTAINATILYDLVADCGWSHGIFSYVYTVYY
jgi:hypothetical protein